MKTSISIRIFRSRIPTYTSVLAKLGSQENPTHIFTFSQLHIFLVRINFDDANIVWLRRMDNFERMKCCTTKRKKKRKKFRRMKKSLVLVFNSQRNKNHCELTLTESVYSPERSTFYHRCTVFFRHYRFLFQHKENIWFLRLFLSLLIRVFFLFASLLIHVFAVRVYAFLAIDFIFQTNLTLIPFFPFWYLLASALAFCFVDFLGISFYSMASTNGFSNTDVTAIIAVWLRGYFCDCSHCWCCFYPEREHSHTQHT